MLCGSQVQYRPTPKGDSSQSSRSPAQGQNLVPGETCSRVPLAYTTGTDKHRRGQRVTPGTREAENSLLKSPVQSPADSLVLFLEPQG